MKVILLIALALLSPMVSAELYRWVDDSGKVHFSDKPLDSKAEAYKPPPIPVIPAGPSLPAKHGTAAKKGTKAPVKYESLTVTAPTANKVFFPGEGDAIAVSATLKPGLDSGSGHVGLIYLDGKVISKGTALNVSLNNLPRGAHQVYAAIINEKGKVLIKASPVSFFVKRHHR